MKHSTQHYLRHGCSLFLSACITITCLPLQGSGAEDSSLNTPMILVSPGRSTGADSKAAPPPVASASLGKHPTPESASATTSNLTSSSAPNRSALSPRDIDRSLPSTPDITAPSRSQAKPSAPATALAGLGRGFIENKGQWDKHAKFQLGNGRETVWLISGGLVFDSVRGKAHQERDGPQGAYFPTHQSKNQHSVETQERFVFCEDFIDAQSNPSVEPAGLLPGAYNYLIGNDPAKWHTDVHAFAEVVYHNVWEGVDVKLARNGADVEQEFVVHPGANLSRVQIAYRGVEKLELAKDGSLLVQTAYGEVRETAPKIYQEIAGKREPVSGTFKLTGRTSYTFDVNSINPQYALVIDPTLLYSTFLGGSEGYGCGPFSCSTGEFSTAVAVDGSGNAYVTGFTQSLDFPTTPGAFQTTNSGSSAFVTELNALGSQLVYSTYLGSSSAGAEGFGIAVDASGEAVVAGGAGPAFPVTASAFQQSCYSSGYGYSSGFLTKLTAAGDGLVYSTCFGGPFPADGYLQVNGVGLDTSGKAYIAGIVTDVLGLPLSGLPTTSGAFQLNVSTTASSVAFLSVVDPSASGAASLLYSTYLGGSTATQGNSVAVDSFGMAYVTGSTNSKDFPVTAGAFQTTYPGSAAADAFVAKFNPSASGAASLIYSTYLGGNGIGPAGSNGQDIGLGIALDALGQAHVTGSTGSANFPVTPGAFQATELWHSGFITTLNAAGNGLVQSTFLGGSSGDQNTTSAIALDFLGDAFVTGTTGARDFPTTPDAFQPSLGGSANAFVTELNPAGTALVYSSYLGGNKLDQGSGIAVDAVGDAYVTGYTESINFPVTPFAFQPVINPGGAGGPADAFVTKFGLGTPAGLSITGIEPPVGGNSGSVTATVVGTGFEPSATLSLVCSGQPDIVASNVSVSLDGRTITGTFALTGAQAAGCSVVVANADGTTISDAGAFSIQQGGSPKMWVDIVGLSKVRGGVPENYYVVYGNTGTIDSNHIVVSIEVPNNLTWQLQPGQTPVNQTQINGNLLQVFAVPPVPPQGSGVIVVTLTAPPVSGVDVFLPAQFSAWINPQ
jgi:hypothetical protein